MKNRLSEASTKSGLAQLAANAALFQTLPPTGDPVQMVLQIVMALVSLWDIFRREKRA